MSAKRYLYLILVPTILIVGLLGNSLAATMGGEEHDYLHWILGDATNLYIINTSGNGTPEVDERAEVPFSFYFADEVPAGNLTTFRIRIHFEPGYLIYDGVIPTGPWENGTVTEVDYLEPENNHNPDAGRIVLDFSGVAGVSAPDSPTEFAKLYFKAKNQLELHENDLLFYRNADYNWVGTYDEVEGGHDWYPHFWDDGTVKIRDYTGAMTISTVPGLLADQDVSVSVLGTTDFNMFGVYQIITYNTDLLTYEDGTINTTTFPNLHPYSSISETTPGTIEVFIYCDIIAFPESYYVDPITDQELFNLTFDVKPRHNGNPNPDNQLYPVSFDFNNCQVFVYYGRDASCYCQSLIYCLDQEDYIEGGIDVPNYVASINFEPQSTQYGKNDVITYVASIQNNFPAGEYASSGYNGTIQNVIDVPEFINYGDIDGTTDLYFEGGLCNNGVRVFHAQQYYSASKASFVHSPSGFTNMYTAEFSFDPSYEPEYSERTVNFTWRENAYCDYDWYYTKLTDTTGSVTTAYSDLTLNASSFEIEMGRFYAPYSTDEDVTVDQPLSLSSNFEVGHFEVQVEVTDGDARITGVSCESGVEWEYLVYQSKIRIYYNGSSAFCSATGEGQEPVATIHYRINCGAYKVAEDGPGGGSQYVTASISFPYADMQKYGDGYQFVDKDPNNVKGKCVQIKIERPYEDEFAGELPTDFALSPNRPNPFNPSTNFSYDLPAPGQVLIEVYNITGQKVRTLVDDFMPAGRHEVEWNSDDDYGNRVASGVYLYRMEAGDFRATKKMILMK